MIIAGSISMENMLTLHGIPHTVLGGLFRLPVPPFSREEAQAFLLEKLRGTPAGTEEVLDITLETLPDFVPEFLRIAEMHLRLAENAAHCQAVLNEDVLPAIRRSFLTQFDERLTKHYPGDELVTAEKILDRIARANPESGGARLDGKSLPPGYRRTVQMLQYDNFIVEGTDYRWQFSLNLIRQWWRAERGLK